MWCTLQWWWLEIYYRKDWISTLKLATGHYWKIKKPQNLLHFTLFSLSLALFRLLLLSQSTFVHIKSLTSHRHHHHHLYREVIIKNIFRRWLWWGRRCKETWNCYWWHFEKEKNVQHYRTWFLSNWARGRVMEFLHLFLCSLIKKIRRHVKHKITNKKIN